MQTVVAGGVKLGRRGALKSAPRFAGNLPIIFGELVPVVFAGILLFIAVDLGKLGLLEHKLRGVFGKVGGIAEFGEEAAVFYFCSFNAGNPFTIFIVSMLTRTTRLSRSRMYLGCLCSLHQSLGSFTMPLSLSRVT
jgi:hypothetical protein